MKRGSLLRTSNSISNIKGSHISTHFKNVFDLFIYKKSLRINEAIFLITAHITDKESIKFNIRELSIKLSTLSIKINSASEDKKLHVLYDLFMSVVVELMTLLEVLFIAGFIRDSNFNLINMELVNIYGDIKDRIADGFTGGIVSIDQDFFTLNMDQNKRTKTNVVQGTSVKDNNIKDIQKNSSNTAFNYENDLVSRDFDKRQKNNTNLSDIIKKTDRKEKILSFFNNDKKLTIKDIVLLLPQYGEKTIQRELVKMLKNGDLVKEGEKRWTVYFLPKK